MNNEDFFLYDRITYTTMWFDPNISLEFVVCLASKRGGDNSRMFFHSEYEKTSSYRLTDLSRTIRVRPRYYFVITIKDAFGDGFVIKHTDAYILTETIKTQVLPWFFGKDRIFGIQDNKLVITGEYKPYMYPQSEYKYLSFIPCIKEFNGGFYKEGVRMFVNSTNIFVDLTLDDFLAFLHILQHTDMVTLAATLMNYAKTPPYGINMGSENATGLGASRYSETNIGQQSPLPAYMGQLDYIPGKKKKEKAPPPPPEPSNINNFLENTKTKGGVDKPKATKKKKK